MAAYSFAPNLDDAQALIVELRAVLEKLCERADRVSRPRRQANPIGPFGVLSIILSEVRLVLEFQGRTDGRFGGGRAGGGGGGASF